MKLGRYLLALIILLICCAFAQDESLIDTQQNRKTSPINTKEYKQAAQVSAYLNSIAKTKWCPKWAPLPIYYGQTHYLKYLTSVLKSKYPTNRAKAVFLLGMIGYEGSYKDIKPLLKDSDINVKMQAALALSMLGKADGIYNLKSMLATQPEWIRIYVIYGLWKINSSQAKTILNQSLKNQLPFPKKITVQALKTKYIPSPSFKIKPVPSIYKNRTLEDIWVEASDLFFAESDWWWHSGDYEHATRCLMSAAMITPSNIDAFSSAAWLQWSLGKNDSAIAIFKEGIRVNPKNADIHFEYGYHLYNIKKFVDAEPLLKKSVELGVGLTGERVYAHCLENTGKLKESMLVWEKLLKENPDDVTIKNNYNEVKDKIDESNKTPRTPQP